MLHLGPIWYHSEPSDVPYSENLPRPISWFGLFLQQNDSNTPKIVHQILTLIKDSDSNSALSSKQKRTKERLSATLFAVYAP